MSTPPVTDLVIDQGDDEEIELTALQPGGSSPLDLSGCTIWFVVRVRPSSTDTLIEKTTTSGITVTDAAAGLATVTIGNSDTANLDDKYLNANLAWEAQVKDGSGKIITLGRGKFTITRELVRATS